MSLGDHVPGLWCWCHPILTVNELDRYECEHRGIDPKSVHPRILWGDHLGYGDGEK